VTPAASRSALDTIRGTIRVSVRVTLDKQGTVVDTAVEERGSSRYFERLAVAAAKKWTFTPANLADKRTVLVRFNFTRDGVTVHANPTP
jgi:TonB family protein